MENKGYFIDEVGSWASDAQHNKILFCILFFRRGI